MRGVFTEEGIGYCGAFMNNDILLRWWNKCDCTIHIQSSPTGTEGAFRIINLKGSTAGGSHISKSFHTGTDNVGLSNFEEKKIGRKWMARTNNVCDNAVKINHC